FHRLDMDPLIALALPPSYEVPGDPAEQKTRSQLGHPLAFFRDVAGIALDRIQVVWPEAREYFGRLVYAVCYLPDAEFRSCSASRYTGVILISNRDCSVLDLEESLVHEAGHQLLYNIAEADPVTDDSSDEQYRLPWSGRMRDFYGYVHAFYIYVLLAQYHERVMGCRAGPDGDFAAERVRHIVRGLVAALPDFQTNPHLTPRGRVLMDALALDVAGLERRNRGLIA
ncbi:MAG: aKG-HExxH-type peptide beta-hydroxylase, partial [Terriglobales bacterium]